MRKTIDLYFKFMWNNWSFGWCRAIFGGRAEHLWDIWLNVKDDYDYIAAPAVYWSRIDTECQEAICKFLKTTNYQG